MSEPQVEEKGWVWNLAIVWLAVLIAIMGMSLVIPFLPLYLAELHVPPGEVRMWAGLIGGVNFLMSGLLAPFWGTLADRFGRKRMALRALVGLAIAVALMGYAQNVQQLFVLRMIQGAFGGFVAEAIALVTMSVPKDRLGGSLGLLQSAVVGGHFLGPLAGGELSHRFEYRATFQITGAALLIAMLLILVLVRERRAAPDPEQRKGVAANVRDLLAIPELRWMLVVVLCSQSGMMLINPQISLYVKDLVADPASVNRIAGFVAAAPAITSFLMATVWGRAGDRRGHAGVLGVALMGAAVVVPWAAFATHWGHLFLMRLGMGAFTAALNPSTHSVVAHRVHESRLGGAFSLLASAQMFGACIGPFLSGPLATTMGVRVLFPMTSLLLFAACAAAFRVRSLGPPVKDQ